MTKNVYRTARGRVVDMGALILQNENVRAVGNMGVNARGDLVDSQDRVIDKKNQQVQRQMKKTRRPVEPAQTTAPRAKTKLAEDPLPAVSPTVLDTPPPVAEPQPQSGLAAAMAKSRKKSQ